VLRTAHRIANLPVKVCGLAATNFGTMANPVPSTTIAIRTFITVDET
jgi:hypothetical protein